MGNDCCRASTNWGSDRVRLEKKESVEEVRGGGGQCLVGRRIDRISLCKGMYCYAWLHAIFQEKR